MGILLCLKGGGERIHMCSENPEESLFREWLDHERGGQSVDCKDSMTERKFWNPAGPVMKQIRGKTSPAT